MPCYTESTAVALSIVSALFLVVWVQSTYKYGINLEHFDVCIIFYFLIAPVHLTYLLKLFPLKSHPVPPEAPG